MITASDMRTGAPKGPVRNLIPPLSLIQDGSGSHAEFVSVGEYFVQTYLIGKSQLFPDAHVLDVGCGIGRIARVLTKHLGNSGRYEGFDIIRDSIDWCREAYRDYRNFRFTHADIYNSRYNRDGKLRARDFVFPYDDNSFDVVFLTSVFTHMLPEDVGHYMEQMARVLRPGGRSVATYFLLNPEAILAMTGTSPTVKVPFSLFNECRVASLTTPETAVALDEAYVRNLYLRTGQYVTEIQYGYWCGRKPSRELQDVIVAAKELA